jgi:hypothetical protein
VSDFRDLVDVEGIDPDEEQRLRRVHDLLVQAGPPPDLPPSLEQAPEGGEAEIVQFPLLPRRRWAVAAVIAATVALLAFGGGYLTGHSKAKPESFASQRVVAMHGQSDALAVLRIAREDDVGNWPMQLEVTGLPEQPDRDAHYELWLTKGGKPVEPCGIFRVDDDTTRVRFSVPYDFKDVDGWVITEQHGDTPSPGRVVLTT